MKKTFKTPVMDVVRINALNIIAASACPGDTTCPLNDGPGMGDCPADCLSQD